MVKLVRDMTKEELAAYLKKPADMAITPKGEMIKRTTPTNGATQEPKGRTKITELSTKNRSLQTLQDECVQLGGDLQGMMRQTLETAVALGGLLIGVKAQMAHGEFTPWVEANMPVSIKQCQRYMRVHEGIGLLPKGNSGNPLTLAQMDREISRITRGKPKAPPKSEPKVEPQPVELPRAVETPASTLEILRSAMIKHQTALGHEQLVNDTATLLAEMKAGILRAVAGFETNRREVRAVAAKQKAKPSQEMIDAQRELQARLRDMMG